eukprot:566905-Hanusia_phi.AAC.1
MNDIPLAFRRLSLQDYLDERRTTSIFHRRASAACCINTELGQLGNYAETEILIAYSAIIAAVALGMVLA